MRYLLLRMRRLVVVFFTVTILTFLLVNVLPGDVAYDIAGQDASQEEVEEIRKELGLDRPVFIRYAEWLGNFLVGDWGKVLPHRRTRHGGGVITLPGVL